MIANDNIKPPRPRSGRSDEENRNNYEAAKKWGRANPEAGRAHSIVYRALKSGSLVRGACEVCGATEQVEFHHDDYSKPLEVHQYCRLHHRRVHKALREQEAA